MILNSLKYADVLLTFLKNEKPDKRIIDPSVFFHNHEKNIERLFHLLAQFLFVASDRKVHYYYQWMNIEVVPRAAKQLKT